MHTNQIKLFIRYPDAEVVHRTGQGPWYRARDSALLATSRLCNRGAARVGVLKFPDEQRVTITPGTAGSRVAWTRSPLKDRSSTLQQSLFPGDCIILPSAVRDPSLRNSSVANFEWQAQIMAVAVST